MSEEDYKNLWKRLEDMYPFAYAYARDISIKFSKICKDVLPESKSNQGETKTLSFTVGSDSKGDPRLIPR